MDVDRLITTTHVTVSVVGTVLVAVVLVYARASAVRLRSRYATAGPGTPTADEIAALARWGRRDVVFFAATMAALLVYSAGSIVMPPTVRLAAYVTLLGLSIATLAHHFLARCPHCGRHVGLQSGLGTPSWCEICLTPLRPGGGVARGPLASGVRYASTTRVLGLPLLAVAVGADPASGEARGVARGILAVGDVAIGGLAVGGVAGGVVAVGGVAAGVACVGGLSAGVLALGGLALGGVAVGGMAIGVSAVGGLAVGRAARGGLAILLR